MTMNDDLRMMARISVVLGLLFLAGCGPAAKTPASSGITPGAASPTLTPSVTLAPGVAVSATPGAVPTAVVSPTSVISNPSPTASPSESSQGPVTFTSMHMLTPSEGWATGKASNGPPAIFHTTDAGADWQNVSPAGAVSAFITATYFLDPDHAWVAAASPGGSDLTTITVYRTADGGQTWDSGAPLSIQGAGGPGPMDFIDPQFGWFIADLGVGLGHEAVETFRTVDGGLQWEGVSLTSGYPGQSTPGSLPFACDKSGLTFRDGATGWAAGSCPGGGLFFYVTYDAGEGWQQQALPPPPGYPANIFSDCQCGINTPLAFVSSQVGFFAVQIVTATGESAFLYVTNDGGVTWSPRALPLTHLIGGPDFIDANTGWVTDGQALNVTHDGGQSWATVGQLPTTNLVGGLNFVNANDGWLTDGPQLYVTHDGGQNWSSLTSAVLPLVPTPIPGAIPLPPTRQPIHFAPGSTTYTLTTDLTSGVPQAYTLQAQAGQHMTITASGQVSLQVYGPQDNPLTDVLSQPGPWETNLPQTGNYSLALLGAGKVTLSIYISPLPAQTPAPVPLPATLQRINFAPGATSATVSANLARGIPQGYILGAQAGQQMDIVASGNATLALLDPEDNSLPPASFTPGHWEFALPQTGDYIIALLGQGQVTLTVSISPLSSLPAVTLADDGQTITLHSGQRFLLDLGADYDWTVTVDDPAIVSRMVNVLTIQGSQGLYEAHQPGHTTLRASGDPICRAAQPPCDTPSRLFELQVVVDQ
jgi:photosystem II stability/assembly factor-like uncharacterized protein